MVTLTLESFLGEVEQRKAALGVDESPKAVDARRNKGARRNPTKREALRRAERRASAAGVQPVTSYI